MPDQFEIAVIGLIARPAPETRNGKEFLFGQRRVNSTDYLAGQWQFPEGSPETLEDLPKAVTRKMVELTGLTTEVKKVICDTTEERHLDSGVFVRRWLIWYWLESIGDTDRIKQGNDWRKFAWLTGSQILPLVEHNRLARWPREVKHLLDTYYS